MENKTQWTHFHYKHFGFAQKNCAFWADNLTEYELASGRQESYCKFYEHDPLYEKFEPNQALQ